MCLSVSINHYLFAQETQEEFLMVIFLGIILCSFRSIPAHRLVLCLCSSYFEAMFGRAGFAESGEKEVLLEGEVI